ncbi:MAG: hypothetical protein V4639_13280 [Pseudomonadota bacterium]
MHAGRHQVVAKARQDLRADLSVGVNGRHQIRKNTVKFRHLQTPGSYPWIRKNSSKNGLQPFP